MGLTDGVQGPASSLPLWSPLQTSPLDADIVPFDQLLPGLQTDGLALSPDGKKSAGCPGPNASLMAYPVPAAGAAKTPVVAPAVPATPKPKPHGFKHVMGVIGGTSADVGVGIGVGAKGVVSDQIDTVTEVLDMVMHPKVTAQNMASAVRHPIRTLKYMGSDPDHTIQLEEKKKPVPTPAAIITPDPCGGPGTVVVTGAPLAAVATALAAGAKPVAAAPPPPATPAAAPATKPDAKPGDKPGEKKKKTDAQTGTRHRIARRIGEEIGGRAGQFGFAWLTAGVSPIARTVDVMSRVSTFADPLDTFANYDPDDVAKETEARDPKDPGITFKGVFKGVGLGVAGGVVGDAHATFDAAAHPLETAHNLQTVATDPLTAKKRLDAGLPGPKKHHRDSGENLGRGVVEFARNFVAVPTERHIDQVEFQLHRTRQYGVDTAAAGQAVRNDREAAQKKAALAAAVPTPAPDGAPPDGHKPEPAPGPHPTTPETK